ncbi:AraC family transcriptional regulator [Paenibacillus oryzisoli]|uniref:helix-turn-helix domain-containing protein n=1 Tax=Paenibacillus oryzisoli TaxID=1850517 RepID=UPI003D2855C9
MHPVSRPGYPFIYLSSIHKRCYRKRNVWQRAKTIPGDLLVVMEQGQGRLYAERQTIRMQPGQCVWLSAGMQVDFLQESDSLAVYVLAVRELSVARRKGGWSCEQQVLEPSDALKAVMRPAMLEGVQRLYKENRHRATSDADMQQRFQLLLHELREPEPDAEQAVQGMQEAENGIERTIRYMHEHYSEKIKLDTLADLAGLTPTSYSRSFKRAKQVSPIEYLNQIRIDSAKRLLQLPESSVKSAAGAVGMGSEFYFSRMFKKAVGLSPTLFVKRRQLRVASASCFRYKDCLYSLGLEDAFELDSYLSIETEEDRRFMECQLEQMREYRPDVIVADSRHLSLYERLRQIAPTVMLRFTMDWRSTYMRLAELVGRESEARLTCRQLELRVEAARKRLAQTIGSQTISLVRLQHGRIRVQGRIDHPLSNLLYTELGLQPGSFVPPNQRLKDMSLESLAPFDTDYLLVYQDSEEDKDLLPKAVWQGSAGEATRVGRVGKADGSDRTGAEAYNLNQTLLIPNWVSMSWAPTGQHQIIDELERWGER